MVDDDFENAIPLETRIHHEWVAAASSVDELKSIINSIEGDLTYANYQLTHVDVFWFKEILAIYKEELKMKKENKHESATDTNDV